MFTLGSWFVMTIAGYNIITTRTRRIQQEVVMSDLVSDCSEAIDLIITNPTYAEIPSWILLVATETED